MQKSQTWEFISAMFPVRSCIWTLVSSWWYCLGEVMEHLGGRVVLGGRFWWFLALAWFLFTLSASCAQVELRLASLLLPLPYSLCHLNYCSGQNKLIWICFGHGTSSQQQEEALSPLCCLLRHSNEKKNNNRVKGETVLSLTPWSSEGELRQVSLCCHKTVDQCGKIMRPTCSVCKGPSCYCQCSNVSHLRHKFITVSYMPCAICLHYHKLFPLEMWDWKTKCIGSFHAREMNFTQRKWWPHSNLIHSLVSVKSLSIPHVGAIILL